MLDHMVGMVTDTCLVDVGPQLTVRGSFAGWGQHHVQRANPGSDYFFLAYHKMSKRSATELLTPVTTAGQPFTKASGSGSKRDNVLPDDMGEFEDAWEDEIESDEDAVDAEAGQDEDGL
jgi:hypothetical protein